MIVSLRGVLEAAGPDWIHLQAGGGVTLRVSVPPACLADLGGIGGIVRLFTHLRLTDEQPVLYGFPTGAARDLFLTLLSVSGVGPRMALSLVSTLGVDGLQQAIEAGDMTALSAARGVGRRTAGRVILELKGKLELDQAASVAAAGTGDGEVVDALTALGYTAAEVRRALAGLEHTPDQSLEDRIRLALGRLGGGG